MKQFIFIILMTTIALNNHAQSKTDTINVGAILSFSGIDGKSGQANKNALQLCIDTWNSNGGVNGKHIQLEVYDTKSDPTISASLADSMISNYNPNIVYLAMTDVALNTQSLFEANKTIQLIAAGGNVFVNNPSYILRGYFSVYDLASYFVENISEFTDKNSFSILYDKNGFTDMYVDALIKMAQISNVKINHLIDVKGNMNNYATIITSAGMPKDETIYIAAPHVSMPLEPLGELIKLLRENGYTGAIISDAAIIEDIPKGIYGNNNLNLYYLSIKKSASSDKVKEDYYSRFGTDMDERSLVMYNGLNTVFSYMNTNHSTEPDKVMKSINDMINNQVIDGTMVSGNEIRIGVQINKVKSE